MIGTRRHRAGGFTIIELMVVTAILGVLASIALPAFMKNARRAKLSEATLQLNRIYVSSKSYILETHRTAGLGTDAIPQFPDTELITPAVPCCNFAGGKCPVNPTDWTSQTWQALMFEVNDPHYYRYEYISTGTANPGVGSNFFAVARGDLNCDGRQSDIELYGIWSNMDNDVHGSGGFYMADPLE